MASNLDSIVGKSVNELRQENIRRFIRNYQWPLLKNIVIYGVDFNDQCLSSNSTQIKKDVLYDVFEAEKKGEMYSNEQITIDNKVFDTTNIFDEIAEKHNLNKTGWSKELVDSVLGENHFKIFLYAYNKHNLTGKKRVGTEEVQPSYFIHSLRVAKAMLDIIFPTKEHKRIAIDLSLIHDLIEEMISYRNKQLEEKYKILGKKAVEDAKNGIGIDPKTTLKSPIFKEAFTLEQSIKLAPEYLEIVELFPEEKPYAVTLVTQLKAISKIKGEDPQVYLSRLAAAANSFYHSGKGLIKKYWDNPLLVKAEDGKDNTRSFKELGLPYQESRLKKNIILLNKFATTLEMIEDFNIYDSILSQSLTDLLELTYNRSLKLLSEYSRERGSKDIVGEVDYSGILKNIESISYEIFNLIKRDIYQNALSPKT